MSPGALRDKIGTDEGGLSQSPPFFVCRASSAETRVRAYPAELRLVRLRCSSKPPIWAQSLA